MTVNYWSEFFQIDQSELKARVVASVNPLKNTLALATDEKPDLYGPFWLSTSCVFMLLISDSFWNVLVNMLRQKDSRNVFNFQQIGFATSLVYGAFGLFPLIFFISNKLLGSGASVVKCACIYGYGNLAFVAASLLSVFPVTALRVIFWLLALLHSVLFLISNLKK